MVFLSANHVVFSRFIAGPEVTVGMETVPIAPTTGYHIASVYD
jgi:hypothetical protein